LAWAQTANSNGTATADGPTPAVPADEEPALTPEAMRQAELDATLEDLPNREQFDPTNFFSILNNAGNAFNSGETLGLGSVATELPEGEAGATSGEGASGPNSGFSTTLSILLLLTVLTLVPAVLVMCTSFTRIVVVLALLRQALGTQQLPPTQVITGLALFLTLLVMAPTLERLNTEVIKPMQDPDAEPMTQEETWEKAKAPIRDFMFAQIEYAGNWDSIYMLMEWREPGSTKDPGSLKRKDVDMLTLVPGFMLSELKVAFLLGFRLYLPFLVIDMVVSSVLISMGMLMLPPVLISLPFKLLLFVLVDGWNLVVANLLNSFDVAPMAGVG